MSNTEQTPPDYLFAHLHDHLIVPGDGNKLKLFHRLYSGLPKDADIWTVWFRWISWRDKNQEYWRIDPPVKGTTTRQKKRS